MGRPDMAHRSPLDVKQQQTNKFGMLLKLLRLSQKGQFASVCICLCPLLIKLH